MEGCDQFAAAAVRDRKAARGHHPKQKHLHDKCPIKEVPCPTKRIEARADERLFTVRPDDPVYGGLRRACLSKCALILIR